MRAFLKCAIAAALCFVGGVSRVCAGDSEAISLDEIARRVTEWRASFVNLRVIWEVRNLPGTGEAVVEWPAAPNPEAGSLFLREEWIWADHGLDLTESWSFFYNDGSSRLHGINAFNGPKGVVFRAGFRKPAQDAPETFTNLSLTGLGVGKPVSSITILPMYGLYWTGTAQWLPEMLREWEWRLEQIEDVGGEPCARIVAAHPDVKYADFTHILWLDLSHDCLVRRYRTPPILRRRAGRDFIVDEFQQLDGAVWFPKRGRLELGASWREGAAPPPHENQVWVVTEAALNQPLDLARFEPPTPAVGTVVDDNGRSYTYGAAATAPTVGRNGDSSGQPTSAGGNASEQASGVSAAPPRPGWLGWSVALATVAIIFLAVGIWFSHRKQEDPS